MGGLSRWTRRILGGGGGVYQGLRRQILEASPADLRIAPTAELPRVWGLLVDLGYDNGTATLVAIADGSTSLYYSSGGGIIGGGGHQHVMAATRRLLSVVEATLDGFDAGDELPMPTAGRIVFRAMLHQGRRSAEGEAEVLGVGDHPLSQLFFAAHDVIGELRLISEAR